jgi:hypothetical protein
LDSETRAKNLFIPDIQVKEFVSEVVLQRINQLFLDPSESVGDSCNVLCL